MSDLSSSAWSEENSQTFVDYGRYFVPNREQQIATIAALVPPAKGSFRVLELCCGEGLLAEAILRRFPTCTLVGYDGSAEMLRRTEERLAAYGERFQPVYFDLADQAWRSLDMPVQAVVSSLAIHHLDGPGKEELFRDVYAMLVPGGMFIVTDVIAPAHPLGWRVAADAWDEAVRIRSLELDGDERALAFFERERWNMYRYLDPEDIDHPSPLFDQLQWLAKAGFVAIDVFWMNAGHAIFGGARQ
jgi:tRNA (cmo5U34)-methyltransferase